MQNLTRIDDPALLIESGVYQIDRTLYQYIEKTGTFKAPQYTFRPLAGEKKKGDIKLNHKALTTRCYAVEGLSVNSYVVNQQSQQLSLF
ncbi:hypothetical protein [Anabaena azotica]|uniref:Uncharacterized protein n=1 Tax=Anabaena azotica FACHB-119 TaxID=947527 RepID=A0ABR8DAC8_9NOST|nr:hypothetical protein [Anabaena azotica]MBD2504074.1 hypothetical protein [Anabaena azotica FACHB-119]